MERQYTTIEQIIKQNLEACKHKATNKPLNVLILGIMAGMFIGLGAEGSSLAMHSISNVGIARLAGGVVFPLGLMMIVILGGQLFTSNCLISMNVFSRQISWLRFIRNLLMVYGSNFIGAWTMAWMINHSGQLNYGYGGLGAYVIKVAAGKTAIDPMEAVISGILCNILVCLAIFMSGAAKDIAGKCLAVFFPIMVFAISGFEHCIANMYYITAGIFAAKNPVYTEQAAELFHLTAEQIAAVSWSGMIHNLIPVTIGNMFGGIVLVGLSYWFLYEKDGCSYKCQ